MSKAKKNKPSIKSDELLQKEKRFFDLINKMNKEPIFIVTIPNVGIVKTSNKKRRVA